MMTGANYERYQQTKLANLVFTYALRDKLAAKGSKVKALCAHPGVAPTSLMLNTMVSATWQRACYLPCISLACTSLTMVSSLSQRLPCLSRSARACLHSSAYVRVHALTCSPSSSPPRLHLCASAGGLGRLWHARHAAVPRHVHLPPADALSGTHPP